MAKYGVLSVNSLTDEEKDMFAEYMQRSLNNPAFELVHHLLGDDYLRFLDILSGCTFKVPTHKMLQRDIESVRLCLYVMKRGFTEESVRTASKLFGRSVGQVRRYVAKVINLLGMQDVLSEEHLNNYITNIEDTKVAEETNISLNGEEYDG